MKVTVDFLPGTAISLSPYTAQCQRILQQLGLKHAFDIASWALKPDT